MDEDVTVVTCMGTNRSFTLDVQKRAGGGRKAETLGSLSVESANQRLTLRACGCLDSLTELEVSPLTGKVSKSNFTPL